MSSNNQDDMNRQRTQAEYCDLDLIADALNDPTHDLDFVNDLMTGNTNQVTFRDIPASLPKERDIVINYEVSEDFKPCSRDWIGLFHSDWVSPYHYITFEWASKRSKIVRSYSINMRTAKIMFEAKPSLYQFLYVCKDDTVAGASRLFGFHQSPDNIGLDWETCSVSSNSCSEIDFPHDGSNTSFEIVDHYSPEKVSATASSTPERLSTLASEAVQKNTDLPRRCTSDHTTLAGDFKKSDSEENIYNWLTKIDSDIFQDYLNNQEKALMPYEPQKTIPLWDLMKNDPNKNISYQLVPSHAFNLPSEVLLPTFTQDQLELVIQTMNKQMQPPSADLERLLANLQTGPSPLDLHLVTDSSGTSAASSKVSVHKKKCKKCRKLRHEKNHLRRSLTSAKKHKRRLKRELAAIQEMNDIRETLLSNLADEIRELQREKETLTSANDKLASDNTTLKKDINKMKRECGKVAKTSSLVSLLSHDTATLREENSTLTSMKNDLLHENFRITLVKERLERELEALKKEHQELQDQLEDIMFTMSNKGVTALLRKNSNGTIMIQPTQKHGSVFGTNSKDQAEGKMLELEGWSMVTSKRTGRHLSTIATQQKTIEALNEELQSLKQKIKNDNEIKTKLQNHLKASKAEEDDLKQDLAELRTINSLLIDTGTVLSQQLQSAEEKLKKKTCSSPHSKCKSTSVNCGSSNASTNTPPVTTKSTYVATNTTDVATKATSMGCQVENSFTNKCLNIPLASLAYDEEANIPVKIHKVSDISQAPPVKVKVTHVSSPDRTPSTGPMLVPTPSYALPCSDQKMSDEQHCQQAQPRTITPPTVTSEPTSDPFFYPFSLPSFYPFAFPLPCYTDPVIPTPDTYVSWHTEIPSGAPACSTDASSPPGAPQNFQPPPSACQTCFSPPGASTNASSPAGAPNNVSAAPQTPSSPVEDMFDWGFRAFNSLADRCDSELENLCTLLRSSPKPESEKVNQSNGSMRHGKEEKHSKQKRKPRKFVYQVTAEGARSHSSFDYHPKIYHKKKSEE